MNWFKKQLNKLFLNDRDDDDEYYEEEPFDEQEYSNYRETTTEQHQQKRSSFRFPLIDDYEKEVSSTPKNFDQEVNEFRDSRNITDYYQKNAISKVYDVEVSGIRELLEKRQRSKGNTSGVNYSSSIRKVEKKEETSPRIKRVNPTPKVVQESPNPPVAHRRFVPTNVPSPVHGFRKPSNINELLTKKQGSEQKYEQSKEDEENHQQVLKPPNKEAAKIYNEVLQTSKEIASATQIVDEKLISKETQQVLSSVEHPENKTTQQTIINNKSHTTKISDDQLDAREILEELKDQSNQHVPFEKVKIDEEQSEMIEIIAVQKEVNNQQNEIVVEKLEETGHHVQNNEVIESVKSEILHQPISIEIEEVIENDIEEPVIDLKSELYDHVEEIPILVEEIKEKGTEEIQKENDSSNLDATHERDLIEQNQDTTEDSKTEIIDEQDTDVKEKKRGTLPFNVIMLKSDKEKYAAKLAQKQLTQHNDVIKELSRHTNGLLQTNKNQLEKVEEVTAPISSELPNSDITSDKEVHTEKQIEANIDVVENELPKDTLEEKQQKIDEPIQDVVEKKTSKIYVKPSVEFLSPPEEKTEDRDWMESQADVLVEALSHFQVTAQVESIMQGPAVTQFEITVGHGTKVSKIRNLADDLKLALAAKDIRIQAPIPGKSSIGIEIPNRIARAVRLSEVTNSESFIESESPLEAALGLDLTGKPVTIDLRKMPHGLIAGATGSGKSVCINSILVSLLYKATPHELKLMLIDPKMVELAPFNHIPHLVSPVITDVKAATAALKWAVEEMERRYQLFAHAGVRDLPRYNKLAESNGDYALKLPYILIVIDELADLMMMSPADVEEAICRIAQKARACGIHLIVATQRPSVDVITGLIKSNIPTRIAFAVSSQVDSRTILDSQGAERLLGRGDMLYLGNGMSAPIRLQGTFVTDDEIEEIIDHVRSQGEPDYIFEQDELLKKTEMIEEQDELFEEVCRFVYEQGTASTSSIQRKYHIGYNRAARLIDLLESHGFISEQRGSKPREVYITDADISNMFD
ncbi:DNA translocase FtsK [Ureibacillus endophyticus]|uniref:DNA translocase FtsK n=1 Tax=Ureibacillus endophyticus TaxID=1978490 RepID=A0A494ZB82_9BACL|nr:DNA translocase FtsK [Lysinibacillus endophyticus]RKQ20011.1 DNA translocase FtsK [Lysinibacillus endophyticus]